MRLFKKLVEATFEVNKDLVSKFKSAFSFLKIEDHSQSGAVKAVGTFVNSAVRAEFRVHMMYYTNPTFESNGKPCVLQVTLGVDDSHKSFSSRAYEKNKQWLDTIDNVVSTACASLPKNGGKVSYLTPDGKRVLFGGGWLLYCSFDEALALASFCKTLFGKVRTL